MKKTICVSGIKLFRHDRNSNQKTTWKTSSFDTECEFCEFAHNEDGRRVMDNKSDQNAPRVVYCKFEQCPYLQYYEKNREHLEYLIEHNEVKEHTKNYTSDSNKKAV